MEEGTTSGNDAGSEYVSSLQVTTSIDKTSSMSSFVFILKVRNCDSAGFWTSNFLERATENFFALPVTHRSISPGGFPWIRSRTKPPHTNTSFTSSSCDCISLHALNTRIWPAFDFDINN